MKVRHTTARRNLAGILRHGLLTARSKGRLPAVWFHSAAWSSWAAMHTVRRHGGRIEAVVVLEVHVPRAWLRRSKRRGLFYSLRDIPPERIRRVLCFSELAESPVPERLAG